MTATSNELVSVIVPVLNGGTHIREALESAIAQSYQNLEIIVVDDGSTDLTPSIVKELAERDNRVRLVRKSNGGVASARNLGIRHARGTLIAPFDADDLWHPDKIARQVRAIIAGGSAVGLVYTWSSIIDDTSRIIFRRGSTSEVVREPLVHFVYSNFVGCASVPLIRRACLDAVGGYDATFAAADAQGCEDLKLYLAIARTYECALVPEFLVGYRRSPSSMSTKVNTMKRSYDLVMAEVRQEYPDLPETLFRWSKGACNFWLAGISWRAGNYSIALAYAARAAWYDPVYFFFSRQMRQAVFRRIGSRNDEVLGGPGLAEPFLSVSPRLGAYGQNDFIQRRRGRRATAFNVSAKGLEAK